MNRRHVRKLEERVPSLEMIKVAKLLRVITMLLVKLMMLMVIKSNWCH